MKNQCKIQKVDTKPFYKINSVKHVRGDLKIMLKQREIQNFKMRLNHTAAASHTSITSIYLYSQAVYSFIASVAYTCRNS